MYTYKNGSRYEGEFARGKPHGRGVITFRNGSKYEGDFSEGEVLKINEYIYGVGGRVSNHITAHWLHVNMYVCMIIILP